MKLLLLDKDETAVETISGETFINDPLDQKALPGAENAIALFAEEDWTIVFVSNQGGVAAGFKTLQDTLDEMRCALNLFPLISEAYFCPCDPKTKGDHCWLVSQSESAAFNWSMAEDLFDTGFRKPHPGMLQYARFTWEEQGNEIEECLMVGDRPEDEAAAIAAGVPFLDAEQWRHIYGR